MRQALLRLFFTAALCAVLFACAASAETRALLIGCDRFLTQPNTAPSSRNNVAEFLAVLRAGGDAPTRAVTRVDSVTSAEALAEAAAEAFDGSRAEDVCLFYLSTHGLWNQRNEPAETRFLLSDGEVEGSVTAGELRAMLDPIPGTKVLILDACHAGAVLGKGIYKPFDNVFTGEQYKVLCSSGGAEESWFWSGAADTSAASAVADGAHGENGEDGENGEKSVENAENAGGEGSLLAAGQGYFTAAICRALNPQDACPGDLNRDGRVTLAEMKRYLRAHHGESTVQVYPEEDSFCLYLRGAAESSPEIPANRVSDVSFESGALSVAQPEMTFGFTVRRWSRVAYRTVFRRDGRWDWEDADFLYDTLESGPKPDSRAGWCSPGYKERRFLLTPDSDAGGYVLLQVLTLEDDGTMRVAASTVVCITPEDADPDLNILIADGFDPEAREELTMVIQHRCPCELTVTVEDALGRAVRRLATLQPTRPEQLYPDGSAFTWNGRDDRGETAPAGWYRVRVRASAGGKNYSYVSRSVELRAAPGALAEDWDDLPEDVLPAESGESNEGGKSGKTPEA